MDFLSLEMLGRSLCIPAALAFGLYLSRRALENSRPVEAICLGLSLACLQGLLLVDLLLRFGLRLGTALALVAPCCVGLLFATHAALRRRSAAPPWQPESRPYLLSALGLCLTVGLLTNAAQLHEIDDDYWLHAPLQSHMLRGEFPPRNPYFSSVPLAGHYGRDLLIVSAARALQLDLITAQALTTTCCQVLSFLLLLTLFRRFAPGPAAPLGVLCLGLGINMGYMTGMLQFHRNNSALVSLTLLTGFYLLLRLWQNPRIEQACLLSSVLATLAFTYETHFGLLVLAAVSISLARCLWKTEGWRRETSLLVGALGGGLLLACLVGGAFTSLAASLLAGGSSEQPSSLLNQGQQASLSFPKSPFLGLRVLPADSLISSSYQTVPLDALFAALDHQGARYDPLYVPLWSWSVVRMHGLPLLLGPITFLVLWRRRDTMGLLFLALGAWAFLVPGLIHFGPVHEFEYFRWQFAASFGFCGGLAVALGHIWNRGGRTTAALVGALVCLNILPGLRYAIEQTTRAGDEGLRRTLTLAEMPTGWLRRHSAPLRLRDGDVEALKWLSGRTRAGERVLVNFSESDPWEILFESALSNLTGLYAVGHELPRPNDMVGLPPFRMAPSYRAFLNRPSSDRLSSLRLDWLYLRTLPEKEKALDAFSAVPEMEKVYQSRTATNLVTLYRVTGPRPARRLILP